MNRTVKVTLDLTLWDDDLNPAQVAEAIFDHLHATGGDWVPGEVSLDGYEVDQ